MALGDDLMAKSARLREVKAQINKYHDEINQYVKDNYGSMENVRANIDQLNEDLRDVLKKLAEDKTSEDLLNKKTQVVTELNKLNSLYGLFGIGVEDETLMNLMAEQGDLEQEIIRIQEEIKAKESEIEDQIEVSKEQIRLANEAEEQRHKDSLGDIVLL